MAQNYAASHLNVLDERFALDSKTDIIVNKGIRLDFNGKNSVTIYNVDVVAETDYIRSGANRFGALVELGTGTQTFVLSQDKSFTFTIDRGNLEDSMMAQEVAKAVKRQVREVSVPNTDIYRLSILAAYAAANSKSTTVALTNSNTYQYLIAANAQLDELKVPDTGRVAFVTPTTLNLLKRDAEFNKACDISVKKLEKGVIGEVDGITLVKVPTSYLAANTGFLLVHEKTLVSPTKFNSVRTLDEVQGIDGWVAEGRRYYDAFIPTNKAAGLWLHKIA